MTGPSSVDDQDSDTCVGPTSVTVRRGTDGGFASRGRLTVTLLLSFDLFPDPSTAYTWNQ
jgi:hypothetical protein